ncbi:MAG: DUF1109 domain-containing protein [Bradyrhizobiaceae bacterium]|nr:DUF1109 domain-containing protein [Bradyrhizobiaceae bacterium]
MKTDDLIRGLAADNATRSSIERWLFAALAVGLVLSAILFAAILGLRADIAAVAGEFHFLFKFVVTLTLAVTATLLVLRLARPGAEAKLRAIALLAAPLMLGAALIAEFTTLAPAMRMTKLVGSSWATCLASIPLLSAPILVAALIALHHGAPTRPALAGAIAGLLAGGLGAAIYALYCLEDSPFFLATWYTLAISIVVAAGSLAGARLLRW